MKYINIHVSYYKTLSVCIIQLREVKRMKNLELIFNFNNLMSFRYAAAPNSSSWVPRIQKSKKLANRNGKFDDLPTVFLSGVCDTSTPSVGTDLL